MARKKTPTETINGKTYYYKWLEMPRDSEGKRVRKKIRAKSVEELNLKYDKAKELYAAGNMDTKERLFGEYFKEWLYNVHFLHLKPSSKELYESIERLHITPSPLYGIKISNLNAMQIQSWYNTCELSYSQLTAIHRLIRPYCAYMYNNGLTVKDFGGIVKIPKSTSTTNKEVEIFSQEEQKRFVEVAKNSPLKCFFLTALSTGLRIGELEALTWNDFNPTTKELSVNKTLRYVKDLDTGKYKVTISTPKTKCSTRTLKLSDKTVQLLLEQQREQKLLRIKLGNRYKAGDAIFTNSQGNYLAPNGIRREFNKLLKEAGLKQVKFHALRHSFATRLFEHGIPLKTVSVILGHSSTMVTEKVYVHILDSLKQDVANVINDII